ncbi:MAG TPA: hypothetical protein VFI54_19585 [Solirubrobacteraceae bacterium]|nr:hypothetical protein [Solirubrobacteraceae bacterium]
MDPIHPIIPQPPNIPPVAPSPMAGKIDRKRQRDEGAGGYPGGKRRARPDATVSIHGETPTDDASWEDYDAGGFDEDADGGLHVDVSA